MNATDTAPTTNLCCQHGISMAQTGWMYEELGYPAAALGMYRQAVQTLTRGIAALGGDAPTDARHHLGAGRLGIARLCESMGNPDAARAWVESALPNLREAARLAPANARYVETLGAALRHLARLDAEATRECGPDGE